MTSHTPTANVTLVEAPGQRDTTSPFATMIDDMTLDPSLRDAVAVMIIQKEIMGRTLAELKKKHGETAVTKEMANARDRKYLKKQIAIVRDSNTSNNVIKRAQSRVRCSLALMWFKRSADWLRNDNLGTHGAAPPPPPPPVDRPPTAELYQAADAARTLDHHTERPSAPLRDESLPSEPAPVTTTNNAASIPVYSTGVVFASPASSAARGGGCRS